MQGLCNSVLLFGIIKMARMIQEASQFAHTDESDTKIVTRIA